MTHDADSDERPLPPPLPTPAGLALSTLVTTLIVLAVLFGMDTVLNVFQRHAGHSGLAPALGLLPAYGVQRIVAVHRRRPPRRGRAAVWALVTGLAVTAAIVAGARCAVAPSMPMTATLACAYVVALPSAAAVYAWLLPAPPR